MIVRNLNPLSSGNPGSMFNNSETPNILQDPTVLDIAAAHEVSAGQVLIRYQLDKGSPRARGSLSRGPQARGP